MNPVTEDVKDQLVSENSMTFAGTGDWAIYIARMPDVGDVSDRIVLLRDTIAPEPLRFQNRSIESLHMEQIQIQVRGKTYLETKSKIDDIAGYIKGWGRFTTGDGVNYKGIFAVSDAMFLKQDENLRFHWVQNFQAYREQK